MPYLSKHITTKNGLVRDLTICSPCLQKEYKKDLELEVKGKGMSVLEDTPDLLRVKNAGQILNEVPLEILLLVPSHSASHLVRHSFCVTLWPFHHIANP